MKKKTLVMLIFLIIISAITPVVYGMNGQNRPHKPWPWRPRFNETDPETLEKLAQRIETMTNGKIIISSINMLLYAYISFFYINLFRENRSNFSLSLAGLSIVLLVYSITSNPLILWYIGRAERAWLAAFNFIPDIFSTIAAVILIYLSRT